MSDVTLPLQTRVSTSRALYLAIGSVILLFAALSVFNPDPIADEGGQHLHAIVQFYNGDWTLPYHLPMLPTYHVVATLCWKVFGVNLLVLRALSAIFAILGIIVFSATTRYRALEHPADALLHFAWLPILFPFLPMVYTEAMSILCLVLALYMHVRRRFLTSAIILLLACLVRQSNAVWVVFMALWALPQFNRAAGVIRAATVRERTTLCAPAHRSLTVAAVSPRGHSAPELPSERPRPYSLLRVSITRVWGHLIVIALAATFLIYNRGPTMTMVEANRPRFNVAQFYLFAIFIIFLWAPIWVSRLHNDLRTFYQWAGHHQARASLVVMLGIATAALLASGYDNPHPWNRNVSYLRNLPLVGMTRSVGARMAVACLITIVVPIMVRFTLAQENRRLLGLLWLLSLAYLLPHSLAEPRYYIVPALFLNLLTRYTHAQARCLTLWYFAVSMAVAGYVCSYGRLDGGIW